MPSTVQIPMPGDEPFIVWAAEYGPAAVELLNKLALLELQIVRPLTTQGRFSISVGGENATIGVPLMLEAPIANSVVNLTTLTTVVNTLLQYMRNVGQLPTG